MSAFVILTGLGKLLILYGACLAVFGLAMYLTERVLAKLSKQLPAGLQGLIMAVVAVLSLGALLWIVGSFL